MSINQYIGNQKGESLISVIFAVILLAGIFLAVVPPLMSSVSNGQSVSEPSRVCRNVAQNVISVLRSNGIRMSAYSIPMGEQKRTFDSSIWQNDTRINPSRVKAEVGAPSDTRWPNLLIIDWDVSPPYPANTPLLVQSNMNALQAIYQKNNRIACTSDEGIPVSELENFDVLSLSFEKFNVQAKLKVQPYRVSTGNTVAGCPSSLPKVRPAADMEPPIAVSKDIIRLDGYHTDIGFATQVFVNVELKPAFRDPSSTDLETEIKCSLKSQFQFNRDITLPEAAQKHQLIEPSTIVFRMSENPEPGSFTVCRSAFKEYDPDNEIDGMFEEGKTSVDLMSNLNKAELSNESAWVPCSKVKACGMSPINTFTSESDKTITNEYPPFSPKCANKFEQRIIDTSGNLSAVTASMFYNGEFLSDHGPRAIPWEQRNHDPDDESLQQVAGIFFEGGTATRYASAIIRMPAYRVLVPHNFNRNRIKDRHIEYIGEQLRISVGEKDGGQAYIGADGAQGAAGQGEDAAAQARQAADQCSSTMTGVVCPPGTSSAVAGSVAAARKAKERAEEGLRQAKSGRKNIRNYINTRHTGLGPIERAALDQAERTITIAEKSLDRAEEALKKAIEAQEDSGGDGGGDR